MPIAFNADTKEAMFLDDAGEWKPAQKAVNPETKETLFYDGKGWVNPVPKARGVGQLADDAARSLASGATMGFADEIAAGANTALGIGPGKTYAENLAAEAERNKQIPAGIRIPGEVGGAIAGSLATAPITGAISAATGAAKLPGYIRGPLMGAVTGATQGAGEAPPGLENRMGGAATGGAIGFGVGAAMSPLSAGASALRGAISPQQNVTADLSRALQRDKVAPEEFLARYQQAQATRPGVAIPADVGGQNVQGLVERVAQTPGAGRTTVVPFLEGRQQEQMMRLAHDLRGLTGTQKSAFQAVGDTMEQRKQEAKPLYDAAMNFNATQDPALVRTWQQETSTGFGQSFLMRPEYRKTLQTEYGIKNPADAPLMVQIDAWKKVADDFISDNIGTNKARIAQAMRDRVIDVVDRANPAYAEARNAWAGHSRYLDAVEAGKSVLGPKVTAEELAAQLPKMSDAEREAFRIGAVSAVQAKMGNDPAKLADMTKYLRSPEVRQKMDAIMPTPEAKQQWQSRLDFEVGSSALTGRALGNSATARRLAEKADAEGLVGDLVMSAFAGHPPVSLLKQAVTAIPTKIRDTVRSRSDNMLAGVLANPQSVDDLRRTIEAVQRRQAAGPDQLRPVLGRGLLSGIIGE